MDEKLIMERFKDSIEIKNKLLNDPEFIKGLQKAVEGVVDTLKERKKLVICGNGGSASDALHFAGEIVGRFQKERAAWPAIVLNSDVATMTAIANDYGFDEVYARQAEAHLQKGDMFIGISTSGNSANVIRAAQVAKEKGVRSLGLLGKDGGKLKDLVDYPIIVPSDVVARIQECHILIIHIICELVEERVK